jgi:acyl-CoA synthetase (NDP forming)
MVISVKKHWNYWSTTACAVRAPAWRQLRRKLANRRTIGYPVVMKVISPDALHKSEAGGVLIGIASAAEVLRGFDLIGDNLKNGTGTMPAGMGYGYRCHGRDGHDFFIGGLRDPAFGPVVVFGLGGIHVEIFRDVQRVLCPVIGGRNPHETATITCMEQSLPVLGEGIGH